VTVEMYHFNWRERKWNKRVRIGCRLWANEAGDYGTSAIYI
jgi:hypothetical protein